MFWSPIRLEWRLYRFCFPVVHTWVSWHCICQFIWKNIIDMVLRFMFSESYCIYLVTSQEISKLAVSLSTNALKFYSPATGQYLGECTGHTGTIHEISFSAPSSPQVICSCSADGTIRAWDTRSFKQVFSCTSWLLNVQSILCECTWLQKFVNTRFTSI